MNNHENRDAEPPRECPNSLKALVYFNFVLLFFVGIMFFGDLKNVYTNKFYIAFEDIVFDGFEKQDLKQDFLKQLNNTCII